jgi:hypothetical protein
MQQFKVLQKLDDDDRVLVQKYRRKKQGQLKYYTEERDRTYYLSKGKGHKHSGRPDNWARKSISKIKDILTSSRAKDVTSERIPTGDPIGSRKDVRARNTIMLGHDTSIPGYHQHVMQPFAHQYGHTIASIAYEEGLDTSVFQKGLNAGLDKARKDYEYKRGCEFNLFLFFPCRCPPMLFL